MNKPLIRTQAELLARIVDAIARGDKGNEFNEYMRCAKFIPLALRSVYQDTTEKDWHYEWNDYTRPDHIVGTESIADIDLTAKRYLRVMERAVLKNAHQVIRIIDYYRAWKWMLGHPDADTFDNTLATPRDVHQFLLNQYLTGEWDQMTEQAQESETNAAITDGSTPANRTDHYEDARDTATPRPVKDTTAFRATALAY